MALAVAVLLLQPCRCLESDNKCRSDTPRLALGGPLMPDVRLPPVHRVSPLPAGESAAWEVSLRVTAFGRLRVQPLLTLPARSATLPGAPSTRFAKNTLPARVGVMQGLRCGERIMSWCC